MQNAAMHNAPIWFPVAFRWFSEYFWLLALILGEFRYRRTLRRIERATPDPGINKDEARRYARRINLAAQLPWALIGLGKMLGFTPTCWYYFFPQNGNPYVSLWYIAMFVQSCFVAWWVIWADGARRIREIQAAQASGRQIYLRRPEWIIKLVAAAGPFSILYWVHFLMLTEWPVLPPKLKDLIF